MNFYRANNGRRLRLSFGICCASSRRLCESSANFNLFSLGDCLLRHWILLRKAQQMIGPKCQLCRKQAYHHRAKDKACPIGRVGTSTWNEKQFFTPRVPKSRASRLSPVAKRGGSEKRKDRKVRRAVKANPCCACGTKGDDFNPVDPAHIRTFKVTQCDLAVNQISLCRQCHTFQHKGWRDFLEAYPHVWDLLTSMGWHVARHPFDPSKIVFSHPEVA